jgi:hypothetical protein
LNGKSANQFTEGEENAPKLGPFPFFSLQKQHIAPQKVTRPPTRGLKATF